MPEAALTRVEPIPPPAPALGPAGPRPGRIDFLDGVRAAAAVYVVLHHIWLTVYPQYPVYTGPWWLGWMAYGQLAVSVFIVVSGFSLAIAPARREWRLPGGVGVFLRRRAWRILPTYWMALLLSALVYGVLTPHLTGDLITGRGLLVHAVLLQDVISSQTPNGAFWSIAVEFQIYFLFPALLLLRRRCGAAILVTLVTIVTVVIYGLAENVPPLHRLLNLTPQFLLLFVLGMAAAQGLDGGAGARLRRWSGLAAGAALVLLVGLLVTHDLRWVQRWYFWLDVIAGALTACTVLALVTGGFGALRRLLASGPLRRVGAFSYSLYCVHLPLLWVVAHYGLARFDVSPAAEVGLQVLVGLPSALAGAYLFSLGFEKPFVTHRSLGSLRAALKAAPTRRSERAVGPGRSPSGTLE